jgi:murein DD-endopeptidase MepM/ murein hydrolase activator NlpD
MTQQSVLQFKFSRLILLLLLGIFASSSTAQETTPALNDDCGLVDAIMFPVESIETVTIPEGYDDFSIQRGQFGTNHTGFDVAFYEQGAPVMAAARGKVTYSDIRGWNDERGVVIIAHDFPDGNRYYTVYGHMEETDAYILPEKGDCVEMGDVVGAIGWPTSSSPHLHYEIRSILPDDGGPGYVDDNPLDVGWVHPLDFTRLWQMRFSPVFVDYATFRVPATVAPAWLENGQAVTANRETVLVTAPQNGGTLWQITMDDITQKVATLPGNRVVAQARSGLVAVIAGGRYQAVWTVSGPEVPFVLLDETLAFVTDGGGVAAYDSGGDPLWEIAPLNDVVGDIRYFESNGRTIGLGIETDAGTVWRVVDVTGEVLYEATFAEPPLIAPVLLGGWMLLADGELWRISGDDGQLISTVAVDVGSKARLAADFPGNSYLYVGDEDNTLLSWSATGELRWQTPFPPASTTLFAPLLAVDGGCLLYGLDMDGRLHVFDAATGDLIAKTGVYAGGSRDKRPNTRLLQVEVNGRVHFSAGYLSLVTLNGRLFAEGLDTCLLG